jgi:hypothetical protein
MAAERPAVFDRHTTVGAGMLHGVLRYSNGSAPGARELAFISPGLAPKGGANLRHLGKGKFRGFRVSRFQGFEIAVPLRVLRTLRIELAYAMGL